MSGAEIVLGVAGLLGPLVAPPLESAFRRIRKPQYKHHTQREEVRTDFVESWTALQSNMHRLAPVLKTLAHEDLDRRRVLKELEKATRGLNKINKGLLTCKPLKRALREQEKTEKIVIAVRKRICDGEDGDKGGEESRPQVEKEEEVKRNSRVDHKKIAERLGPLIVGGKGKHPLPATVSSPSSPSSPSAPSRIAYPPPPTSTMPIPAPRAQPQSPLHLQIITKNRTHCRKHKSKPKPQAEDSGYFEDHITLPPSSRSFRTYDTSIPRPQTSHGESTGTGACHHHHHHHYYRGKSAEMYCSQLALPQEKRRHER